MVVIADFGVPAEQFALGRLFKAFPDIEVELERIVPGVNVMIPYF